jgi:hypothetical protein
LLVNAVAEDESDTVSGFVAAGIGGIELNELGAVCLICCPDAISWIGESEVDDAVVPVTVNVYVAM